MTDYRYTINYDLLKHLCFYKFTLQFKLFYELVFTLTAFCLFVFYINIMYRIKN